MTKTVLKPMLEKNPILRICTNFSLKCFVSSWSIYMVLLYYWFILIDAFDLQYAGIPGCAKSALCKELLNAPGGLGDDRPVHSLMGDLIKGMGYYAAISVCYVPPSVYVHTHTHTEFILLAFSVHTTSQSGSSHFNLVAHPK